MFGDGAALVRVLGAAGDEDDGEGHLPEIFSATLDFARLAQEKDQFRGGIQIQALGDTAAQLAVEGRLTMTGSFALSRAWVRAGLTPPVVFAWLEGILDEPALGRGLFDLSQLESMIDDIFSNLIGQAAGEDSVVYGELSEMFSVAACLGARGGDPRGADLWDAIFRTIGRCFPA